MTFGTSTGSGPPAHRKQSDIALGLSPGPRPFSRSGQCSSGSVAAIGWFCCRWPWSLKTACPKLTEGMDARVEVGQMDTSRI